MELVGMVLVVAATGALVLWPLLRGEVPSPAGDLPEAARDREKELALLAIREVEFDFQTGKLSPEDYAVLRARYEAKALESRREPGHATRPSGADIDALIEAEIAAARGHGRCPACRESLPAGARFCPACGAPAPLEGTP